MQIGNYCLVAGVSIIFLIGCLIHLRENDIFPVETISKFRKLIYVLIAEIAIDCIFALLEGQNIAHVLYLLKGLELFMNPVLVMLVFDIFYDEKSRKQDKMRILHTIMIVIIVSNGILQAVEVIWQRGYIFFIDGDSLYHRGSLAVIYLIILAVALLALVHGIFIFSSRTQIVMKATLIVFTAILVIGILLRGTLPNKNLDFLCMAVAMPFLFIYYSHITLRMDPTTHLLNRYVYTSMKERVNYTTIVIMIDANCFKQINDAHGHEFGDRVLKRIAHSIRTAYGKYAYCFRLGGDEFCAILKPGAFSKLIEDAPCHDDYKMAEEFLGRLDQVILDRCQNPESEEDSYLEHGVSQGYDIFYSKKDYPDIRKRVSFEQAVQRADRKMYRNKNAYKKAHPEA